MRLTSMTKGEKARIYAFATVMAMSAGFTVLIMAGVEGSAGLVSNPSLYTYWVIGAGAVGGGVGLYLARGWMGQAHAMGWARAIVGSFAVALIASVVAGTLILPLYGTAYAPVMMATAVIAAPWLGVIWFGVLLGAHYLMITRTQEIALSKVSAEKQVASYQLSSLTRANFYERKNRY